MKKTDVHTEHCCIAHGCKYGNLNCSVVTGKKEQSFLCETCCEDGIKTMGELRAMMNPSIMKVFVIDWCYECKKQMEELGLKDREIIELTWEDVQKLITRIFIETKGVNVMLKHGFPPNDTADMWLCLDTKKIGQR